MDFNGAGFTADTTCTQFPVLADNDRKLYKEFGLNKVVGMVQKSAVALIDKQGIVQYLHHAINPEEVLDHLAGLTDNGKNS